MAADKDQIRKAQETLKALGYELGNPDGLLGRRTRKAVRAFQRTDGLAATGELDAATLNALSVHADQQATPPDVGSAPDLPASKGESDAAGWFWLLAGAGAIGLYVRSRAKRIPSAGKPSSPSIARPSTPAPLANAYVPTHGEASIATRPVPESAEQRCWVAGSDQITVAGHVLHCGFVYVGNRLVKRSGYGNENCLIDPALRVASESPDVDGTYLHYWPSYYDLPPESRLAYLDWLASERNDPTTYIGYVFLYFYGLEHRLLADTPGSEVLGIVAEVRRLISIYGSNHSFNRYAAALIDAASLVYNLPLQLPPLTLKKFAWSVPLGVRVSIGRLLAEGRGIPADSALAWYTTAQDRRLPIIAVRCEQEFIELFCRRYEEQFPNGITVSTKKRIRGQYQAASSSFSVQLRGDFEKLPDINDLVGPLNKCDPIVESCIKDLSDYARLIGKTGERRGSLLAAVALPKELQESMAAAPRSVLTTFLNTKIEATNGVLSLKELLEQVDPELSKSEKFTKRKLESVSTALSLCGFGFEPDPRMGAGSLVPDTEVVVFCEQEGIAQAECRPEYLAALALADVGAIVAVADGVFSPDERSAFEAEIEASTGLTQDERTRLRARFEFYTRNPPGTRVLNRFKEAPILQREAIARLAVSVATADGNVAVEEMRILEKLYKALSLPQERLYADVHALRRDEDLPTVADFEPGDALPIPRPPTIGNEPALALNSARLAKIRADTAVVTSILGNIFENNEEPAPVQDARSQAAPDHTQAAIQFEGLDADHAALLSDLLQAGPVDTAALRELAAKHNLLSEGAMEAINDWAFDRFGDPVITEDDGINVDQEVLGREQIGVA